MKVYNLKDAIYLVPDGAGASASAAGAVRIARELDAKGALQVREMTQDELEQTDPSLSLPKAVFAVLGVLRLLRGPYLVTVDLAEHVQTLPPAHKVYHIREVGLLPVVYDRGDAVARLAGRAEEEQRYMEMVHAVASAGALHFSYTLDLTHSLQRRAASPQGPDPRFWWNRHMAAELEAAGVGYVSTPVVQGFFASHRLDLWPSAQGRVPAPTLTIVSRRSCRRAGKRYTTRGLDLEGNAANFAETEQTLYVPILAAAGGKAGASASASAPGGFNVYSYLQTRGSVPVVWRQMVSIKYMPTPEFMPAAALPRGAPSPTLLHFQDQWKNYGRQTLISLVNHKGKELLVEKAYAAAVKALGPDADARYVSFDFHKECSKMRYENLSRLVASVESEFAHQGHFEGTLRADGSVEARRLQKGTFRTNCMDCLDRTGVVQSVFARKVLAQHFRDLGLTEALGGAGGSGNPFYPHPFETLFKAVWADNADAMSMQYTGSGAQKTDYTRTGKRTRAGALQDLQKSAQRYVVNNFYDGAYQDALDLFLGRYVPSLDRPSPFAARRGPRSLHVFVALVALAVALFLALAAAVAHGTVGPASVPSFASLALFFALAFPVSAFKLAERSGGDFVTRPLLVDPNPSYSPGGGAAAGPSQADKQRKKAD